MESFVSQQELAKLQKRSRASTWFFRGLAAGMAALFVILCLIIRTANARVVTWAMLISMTLLGWFCIAYYNLRVRPLRIKAGHQEMMLSGAAEEHEGILHMSSRPVQVPRSIRILRVTLEEDESPKPVSEPERIRLNLDEYLADRMPPEGSRIRVRSVNDYITGLEILEQGTGTSGKAERKDIFRQLWRKAAGLFIPFILWTMAVVIIGGFIFSRIMDTDPQHKIVIYADCEIRDGAKLADYLEHRLGEPIRMVKVRSFTYDLFETGGIQNADLLIVSASNAGELRSWLVPLPEELQNREDLLMLEEVPYGFPVYSRETSDYIATTYFDYDPGEIYYLAFSATSLHLWANDGAADNRTMEAAAALLEIP